MRLDCDKKSLLFLGQVLRKCRFNTLWGYPGGTHPAGESISLEFGLFSYPPLKAISCHLDKIIKHTLEYTLIRV